MRRLTLFLCAAMLVCGLSIVGLAGAKEPGSADAAQAQHGTLIACLHEGRFYYRAHPKRCDFFARQGGRRVRDIGTIGLRWSDWGDRKATAQGRDLGNQPIAIVAYHRIHCGGTTAYYQLVQVRILPHGRLKRLKLAKCGEPRFPL